MLIIKTNFSLSIPILLPKSFGCKDHVGVPALVSNGRTITDSLEKAKVLNYRFYSVFADEDFVNIPQADQLEYPTINA